MTRRVVLVDDETLARKRLRRLLASHADIEIVGEAADGPSACKLIDAERPDLVFLDVQMPGMSGFDVLRQLTHRPGVIFVTAHDAFAVQAFEEQAIDYVLKPVEDARLARALARTTATAGGPAAPDPRLENLLLALDRARRRRSNDRGSGGDTRSGDVPSRPSECHRERRVRQGPDRHRGRPVRRIDDNAARRPDLCQPRGGEDAP
jgi:DNA-binding LytR/AlgR family response regulator